MGQMHGREQNVGPNSSQRPTLELGPLLSLGKGEEEVCPNDTAVITVPCRPKVLKMSKEG